MPSRPNSVGQMSDAPKGPLQPAQGPGASGGGTSGQTGGPGSPGQAAPQTEPQATEEEKTWIGLLLSDFDGTPLPDYNFRIVLEKGQVLSGRTDSQGLAHFEGVEPDSGNIHLPEIPEGRDFAASLEGSSGRRTEPAHVRTDHSGHAGTGAGIPGADSGRTQSHESGRFRGTRCALKAGRRHTADPITRPAQTGTVNPVQVRPFDVLSVVCPSPWDASAGPLPVLWEINDPQPPHPQRADFV